MPRKALSDKHLQFSGDFNDPVALLQTCQRMNLEGIVSKRQESAYRTGPTKDWQVAVRPFRVSCHDSCLLSQACQNSAIN